MEPHVRVLFLKLDYLVAEHVIHATAAAEEEIHLPLVVNMGKHASHGEHRRDADAAGDEDDRAIHLDIEKEFP